MKYCPKCKKHFGKDVNYCHSCGKKLKTEKEKQSVSKEETSYRISSSLIPWIIFLLLMGGAGGLLLPTKFLSYQVEVSYTDTEQYTVQVPYEKVEEYTVTVPYETTEEYIESVPVQEQESYQDTECAFLGLFCKGVTKYRTVTNYKDIIKMRAVTEYRDETKYRTVTKIRTEVRERDVIKTRMEKRCREVNWIFEFDAIIKFRDIPKSC